MIQPPTDLTRDRAERARRFAALSGSFDPMAVADVIGAVAPEVTLAVAAELAEACDTRHDATTGQWLMRGTVRRYELDGLASAGTLADAIAWRRDLPRDDATSDLLDALTGTGPFSEPEIRAALESEPARDVLERIAVALDRAGAIAPAHSTLDSVRAALARLEARARVGAMLGRGFFGRKRETSRMAAWLDRPIRQSPVRALFISGLPGIGKSTLLDEAARRAVTDDPPWVIVRLDFDRAGLDVQDRVGLTLEIVRQVSIELGDHAAELRRARLAAAGAVPASDPDVKGARREQVPDELSRALGAAVAAAGRPILVILDTLEVLRGRGETHPARLFDCLDELCDRGLQPLAVIAAGRGDALSGVTTRITPRIDLGGLDPAAADELLENLDVPNAAFADIRALADGNPLVLRLAALAVRDAGVEAIGRARGRQDLAAAYLYRFLLSRIPDLKLRKLARPGLVVRRIHPDVIAQLLGPQLKLGRVVPAEAKRLFDALATHHWLVEPDPSAPGWVRHRADIRSVLLRLLYRDSGATAARIDRAAAAWFAKRPEPFAPVESAYHRLQAMRRGGDTPDLDPAVLKQFDRDTIAELPPEAQDLIHAARGERTSQFRSKSDLASMKSPDELAAAARELEAILERGDVIEARFVYERAFADRRLEPASAEAEVARAVLWRAGRWRAASRMLKDRDGIVPHDDDLFDLSPLLALARLEMRAEIDFAGLVRSFELRTDFAQLADSLRSRGIKGALGDGALGFALYRAGVPPAKPSWSNVDPVGTAAAVWAGPGRVRSDETGALAADEMLAMALARLDGRVSPGEQTAEQSRGRRILDVSRPDGAARVLAGISPYGSPAEALRSLERGSRLLRHLSSVDFVVAERDGLPPSSAAPWSVAPAMSPDGSIASLTSLGLLAEWLGAAAFVLRHADLRLLARSAERWRRTTAGDWAYGAPGADGGREWHASPDATIDDRIAGLLDERDPQRAARRDLLLWWGTPPTDPQNLAGRIEDRLPAAFRAARAEAGQGRSSERARRVAVGLLAREIPSAFVPPMAVLIALERTEGSRTT